MGTRKNALIRAARPEDASAIAHVHVEAWRETYTGLLPQSYIDRLDVSARAAHWQDTIQKDTFVRVAIDDDEIIGFVSAGPFREGAEGFSGEVYAIYLRATHQRRGVGTALFESARGYLGEGKLRPFGVWVLQQNPACRFYEAMGGQIAKTRSITVAGEEFPESLFRFA